MLEPFAKIILHVKSSGFIRSVPSLRGSSLQTISWGCHLQGRPASTCSPLRRQATPKVLGCAPPRGRAEPSVRGAPCSPRTARGVIEQRLGRASRHLRQERIRHRQGRWPKQAWLGPARRAQSPAAGGGRQPSWRSLPTKTSWPTYRWQITSLAPACALTRAEHRMD